MVTRDASFPGNSFLKISEIIYNTPARPYTKVITDRMIELFMKTIPQIEKVEIKFFTKRAISD